MWQRLCKQVTSEDTAVEPCISLGTRRGSTYKPRSQHVPRHIFFPNASYQTPHPLVLTPQWKPQKPALHPLLHCWLPSLP